jgi:predicted PurR-regulated permease PerM
MKIDTSLSFSTRVLVTIAALGVAMLTLQYGAKMVNSLFLAWLIVLVASPLLHRLRDKRAPVWLSILLTLLVILVIFIVFILTMVVAVKSFSDAVPEFSIEIDNLSAAIKQQLEAWGLSAGLQVPF